LFPSPDAAQQFLDAAEPVLSESITGITLQAGTTGIGEVLRHYAGSLSQGNVTLDVQNFLFRTGPVVAKVFIGGFGTTADDALPIAQAAASRIDLWLAGQTTASSSATTEPTASSSGTVEPTESVPALASEVPAVSTDIPYVDSEGISRGQIAVTDVADPFTEHHPDYPPDAGTRYVMVGMAFEAAADQTFEADTYDMLLQDTEGFLWGRGSITRPEDAEIPELTAQDLAPGNRISGVVPFVVPADAVIDRVLYQPESGRLITLASVGA
jgi:hypothetical protein